MTQNYPTKAEGASLGIIFFCTYLLPFDFYSKKSYFASIDSDSHNLRKGSRKLAFLSVLMQFMRKSRKKTLNICLIFFPGYSSK